jgi:hypothetical protein
MLHPPGELTAFAMPKHPQMIDLGILLNYEDYPCGHGRSLKNIRGQNLDSSRQTFDAQTPERGSSCVLLRVVSVPLFQINAADWRRFPWLGSAFFSNPPSMMTIPSHISTILIDARSSEEES